MISALGMNFCETVSNIFTSMYCQINFVTKVVSFDYQSKALFVSRRT